MSIRKRDIFVIVTSFRLKLILLCRMHIYLFVYYLCISGYTKLKIDKDGQKNQQLLRKYFNVINIYKTD